MSKNTVVLGDRSVLEIARPVNPHQPSRLLIQGPWSALKDALTVEAWVHAQDPGDLLFFLDSQGHPAVGLTMDGRGRLFVVKGGQPLWGSRESHAADGHWHHVAVVLRGSSGNCEIYLDGTLHDAKALPGLFPLVASSKLLLGGRQPGQTGSFRGFHGRMAELRLWNTPRSQAQIQSTQYVREARENVAKDPSCLGFWSFHEKKVEDWSSHSFSSYQIFGSARFVDGHLGLAGAPKALVLTAGDKATGVRIAGHSAYQVGGGPFLVELWARTTSGGVLVSRMYREQEKDKVGFRLRCGVDGKIVVQLAGEGKTLDIASQEATALTDGTWHHVAFGRVEPSKPFSIYLDGARLSTTEAAFSALFDPPAGTPLVFGSLDPSHEERYIRVRDGHVPTALPAVWRGWQIDLAEVRMWKGKILLEDLFRRMKVGLTGQEQGLVGYWSFRTGHVVDDSPTRNAEADLGAARIDPSGLDIAPAQCVLHLPGTGSSYMTVDRLSQIDVKDGDFTLEAAFQSTAPGTLLSHGKVGGTDGSGFRLRLASDRILLDLKGEGEAGKTFDFPVKVLDGAWHHVACVRQKQKTTLFLDAVPLSPSFQSAAKLAGGAPLDVGATVVYDATGKPSSVSDLLKGRVDTVRAWRTARELADLLDGMFHGAPASSFGLVGQWSFNWRTPIDDGPFALHGRLIGAAEIVPDIGLISEPPPTVVSLDGVSAYLDAGLPKGVKLSGAEPYTLAAWVRPRAKNATGTLISRRDIQGKAEVALSIQNGFAVAERAVASGKVQGTTSLLKDTWNHVAVTFDGIMLRLYVNATLEAESAAAGAVAETGLRLLLGADSAGGKEVNFFRGEIQEATIWRKALSTDELAQGLDVRRTGAEEHLGAHWSFRNATLRNWWLGGRDERVKFAGGAVFAMPSRPVTTLAPVLRFGGNGEGIDCGGRDFGKKDAQLDKMDKAVTIESWVLISRFDATDQILFSKGSCLAVRRHGTTGRINFHTPNLTSGKDLLSKESTDLLDGRWHHVAAVYDGVKGKKLLYIDGKLDNETSTAGKLGWESRHVCWTDKKASRVKLIDPVSKAIVSDFPVPAELFPVWSCAVDDGLLVSSSGHESEPNLVVFDLAAQKILWKEAFSGGISFRIFGERLALRRGDHGQVFDVRTGKPLFSQSFPDLIAPPWLDGRMLYAFMHDKLKGIDLQNPEHDFQADYGFKHGWHAAVQDGTVVVTHLFTPQIEAVAFDLRRRGARAWSHSIQIPEGALVYGAIAASGSIILGNGAKLVLVRNGKKVQEIKGIFKNRHSDGDLALVDSAGSVITYHPRWGEDKLNVLEPVHESDTWYAFYDSYFRICEDSQKVFCGSALTQDVQWEEGWTSGSGIAGSLPSFCIGYDPQKRAASFKGLMRDVRLWNSARTAAEIQRYRNHLLAGDEEGLVGYWSCAGRHAGDERDLSGGVHAGTYRGTGLRTGYAHLDLARPLPRLTVQSDLLQSWSAADVAADNRQGHPAFRSLIHVVDGLRNPRPGTRVRVWTDEPAEIEVSGVAQPVGPERALEVVTDSQGTATLVLHVRSLSAPTLKLWADFLLPEERVVVHPDDNIVGILKDLEGSDLLKPAASGKPVFQRKKTLLPEGVKPDEADHIAEAVRNAVKTIKKPTSAILSHPELARAAGYWDGGHAVGRSATEIQNKVYRRTAEHAGNWKFDFKARKFTPLTGKDVAALELELAAAEGQQKEGSFWEWFVTRAKDAAEVTFCIIKDALHVVVKWVDQALKPLTEAIQTVAKVGEAIFGFFQQVFEKVADLGRKVLDFFARLFDWEDILKTQKLVKERVGKLFGRMDDILSYLNKNQAAFFKVLQNDLAKISDQAVNGLENGSLRSTMNQGKIRDPFIPGRPGLGTMQEAEAATPAFGLQGTWLMDQASSVSAFSLPGALSGGSLLTRITGIVTRFVEKLADPKAVTAFQQAWEAFGGIAKHPEAFFELSLKGILRAAEGVLLEITGALSAALSSLLELAGELFELLWKAVNEPLEIPLVSWLYRSVTGSPVSPSLLDLLSLAVAVPATILYKSLYGKPADASSSTADAAKILTVCGAVGLLLYAALDMANDFTSPPSAPSLPEAENPAEQSTNVKPMPLLGILPWLAWGMGVLLVPLLLSPAAVELFTSGKWPVLNEWIAVRLFDLFLPLVLAFINLILLIVVKNRGPESVGSFGDFMAVLTSILAFFRALFGTAASLKEKAPWQVVVAGIVGAVPDWGKILRTSEFVETTEGVSWGVNVALDSCSAIAGLFILQTVPSP